MTGRERGRERGKTGVLGSGLIANDVQDVRVCDHQGNPVDGDDSTDSAGTRRVFVCVPVRMRSCMCACLCMCVVRAQGS